MKNLTLTEAIQVTGHLLEHHGTSKTWARDRNGKSCNVHALEASCWCFWGAMIMLQRKFEIVGEYIHLCSALTGITAAWEWDRLAPSVQISVARKLQAYNG